MKVAKRAGEARVTQQPLSRPRTLAVAQAERFRACGEGAAAQKSTVGMEAAGEDRLGGAFLEIAFQDVGAFDFGYRKFFKRRAVAGDPGRAAFDPALRRIQVGQENREALEGGVNSDEGSDQISGDIVHIVP